MHDVLDQSDIDALLSAVSAGRVEEPTCQGQIFSRHRSDLDNVEIREYDFKRPERISQDRMRALRTMHEAFARNFGALLSGFLRTIVEVRVADADQLTYGEFVARLPDPTSCSLINAPDLDGRLCLEISPLIIYSIIGRLLGSSSDEVFIPQRPLTLIETRLVRKVLNRGMADLAEAWRTVRRSEFRLGDMESNPRTVRAVPPDEAVAVIGFEVRLGGREGTMSLCIPFTVLEQIMDETSGQSWFQADRDRDEARWSRLIADRLADARLQVIATLAETTITVSDLRGLEVGDVIVTDRPASSPITVHVEESPKFLGEIGRHEGRRAVKIRRALAASDRIETAG